MRRRVKERLYHITSDLGDEVVLFPNNPGVTGEPKVKRICCAPTIHQCLLALNFDPMADIHVYYTDTSQAVNARCVPDSGFTEEKWILRKKKFKRLMVIPSDFVYKQLRYTCQGRRGSPSVDLYLDKIELEKVFYGM